MVVVVDKVVMTMIKAATTGADRVASTSEVDFPSFLRFYVLHDAFFVLRVVRNRGFRVTVVL